ncbi:MAG: hypothetical protein KDJ36_18260, partial [Hyphomicrobiaceae bacterium]|nr:hypothetical protein [Hyphomicrobiaceae bacterium]
MELMTQVTATASLLSPLEEYLDLRGIPADAVFHSAQPPLALNADPERFLPIEAVTKLFEAAAQATSDPCFG